jgi:hypothetical protein
LKHTVEQIVHSSLFFKGELSSDEFGGKMIMRKRTLLIMLIACLLLLLMPASVAAYYTLDNPTSATVILHPLSKQITKNYDLSIVTQHSDPVHNQVNGARQISVTTSQTTWAAASGKGYAPATDAVGWLAFKDGDWIYQYASETAGTVFKGTDGITIISDQTIIVFSGKVGYFRAHVAFAGSRGNIAAYGFYQFIPWDPGGAGFTFYNTTPFTGGQDAQTYSVVEQSDITIAATHLQKPVQQAALASFQKAMQPGEQEVAAPRCTSATTTDATAGEKANGVHVTVTAHCTDEVYTTQPAQARATALLQQDASQSLGANYQLIGKIAAIASGITMVDSRHGSLAVVMTVTGTWRYHFSASQLHHLAQIIAGKAPRDAQALLAQQPGIRSAAITLSGDFLIWNTLPTDTIHVTVTVAHDG